MQCSHPGIHATRQYCQLLPVASINSVINSEYHRSSGDAQGRSPASAYTLCRLVNLCMARPAYPVILIPDLRRGGNLLSSRSRRTHSVRPRQVEGRGERE